MHEQLYLNYLGIEKGEPSLTQLKGIVKKQLALVPYENISKILRSQEIGPSIPDFEEFVTLLTEETYGGTCFAQNIHLNHLLRFLGFQSKLIAVRREGLLSHVNLRVSIDGANYFVDAGIMSPVAGPYLLHPKGAFDTEVGNQRYVYTPSSDLENCSLSIHRDGKVIRSFQTSSEAMNETELQKELNQAIQKSFDPTAMFMTTLCVHRAFEDYSVGIWNRHVYRVRGSDREVREVQTISELKDAFTRDLALPSYPLEKVLDLLKLPLI